MALPGTRATPRPSIGPRSGAWVPAPSIGPRGRRFEASRQTRARARRRESGGRAPQASRLRGGRRGLHGPPGRDRPHLPARRGAGDRRGQDEDHRSLRDAIRGSGPAQAPGARGGRGRIQVAGALEGPDPLCGRGPGRQAGWWIRQRAHRGPFRIASGFRNTALERTQSRIGEREQEGDERAPGGDQQKASQDHRGADSRGRRNRPQVRGAGRSLLAEQEQGKRSDADDREPKRAANRGERSVASKWGSMAPPETEIETNPNASQTPKMTSSSSWRAPLLLVTATATLKTSMAASTTGRAMRTFARSSCHIVSGARRRSWKPLCSLGIEGVARAEDMNIERNVTNATLDQNPLRLRAGWVSAAA